MNGQPVLRKGELLRLAARLLVTGGVAWYLFAKVPLAGVGHALRVAALLSFRAIHGVTAFNALTLGAGAIWRRAVDCADRRAD